MTAPIEAAPGLLVRLDIASPVEHEVALVAVCVVVPRGDEPLGGSVGKLDRLLGGAIERMRQGVKLGDTRLVSGASGISASELLLIGLGRADDVNIDAFRLAAQLAVTHALALDKPTLGFAPGVRDAGITSLDVTEIARAVVAGARAGFAHATAGRRVAFALEVSAANVAAALAGLK